VSLRGRTAIVGVGEAGIGIAPPGITSLDLAAMAATEALRDAGLSVGEVDAVFTASAYFPMPTLNLAEYLGIQPAYADGTNTGGNSFVSHLLHAMCALEAGICNVALIAYGSTQKSDGGKLVSVAESSPYESSNQLRDPVSMYALAAARHIYEYGTTREHLAEIAVAARKWARLTPGAFATDPLTIEEVLAARIVSSPLGVLDCCLVTDGAGAVVLTTAERAGDLPSAPVYVLGAGEATTHRSITQMPDVTVTGAVQSAARAFEMAQLSVGEVDVAEIYDAFTITTLLFLEDLGFCAKGEGGAFVENGGIAPGGHLPVNTNGGGLSYCHPGMNGLFLMIEATRQLRGGCGQRQVERAETAVVHANGGVLSSQATAVLGSMATA
jgi:acetyl-CoA acetyltransferase